MTNPQSAVLNQHVLGSRAIHRMLHFGPQQGSFGPWGELPLLVQLHLLSITDGLNWLEGWPQGWFQHQFSESQDGMHQTSPLENKWVGQSHAFNLHPLNQAPLHRIDYQPLWVGQVGQVRQRHIFSDEPRRGLVFGLPSLALPLWAQNFSVLLFQQGFLFVTLTWEGQTLYLSNETLHGTNRLWEGKILSLPSVTFSSTGQGGYAKVSWGQIQLTPDCFQDEEGQLLSPPKQVLIKGEWGADDQEGFLSTAFEGQAYLRSRSAEALQYDLFEPDLPLNLLEEGIAAQSGVEVTSITLLDPATGLVSCLTAENHEFLVGDEVYFQALDNQSQIDFEQKATLVADPQQPKEFQVKLVGFSSWAGPEQAPLLVSGQIVARPLAMGKVEHLLAQATGRGDEDVFFRPNLRSNDLCSLTVYEEGVPFGQGEWLLDQDLAFLQRRDPEAKVGGKLSLSGQAGYPGNLNQDFDNLLHLFSWAASRLGKSLINPHLAERFPLDFVVSQQMRLVDFLDQVAGYCNFYFYFDQDKLYLQDRSISMGVVRSLEEQEILELDYQYELPVKEYQASYKVYQVVTDQYSRLEEREQKVILQGTTSVGETKNLQVFNRNPLWIKQRLQTLRQVDQKSRVTLTLPLNRPSNLGEEINFTDQGVTPAVVGKLLVESIQYDFEQDSLTLSGNAELN